MDALSLEQLFAILIALLCCSAFFSSSETGMVSLNRYRLRHLVNKKHSGALRASKLLERTDRLIGVILIGNNLVNIFITLVAGKIAVKIFGDWEVGNLIIMPFVLTLVILIFAEVTPKSIAAVYPEKIAFPASMILRPLLTLSYPVVRLVNSVSNGISRIFGMDPSTASGLADHLHPEELRTVVDEAGELLNDHHQGMLLNVLDLEKSTVEDILVPRNEITGIDIEAPMDDVLAVIQDSEYTMLPVYEGDINEVIGILHLRNISRVLRDSEAELTARGIRKHLHKPYFIPESTPLSRQLLNFQKNKARMALVVDEYGDLQGLVTLSDLLEEIVGDFVTDAAEEQDEPITLVGGGWFRIDAQELVRDINRELGWKLPTDGPKTLNGVITEFLEHIPDAIVSFEIGNYRFQIDEVSDTRIEKALVFEKDSAKQHDGEAA
ncbi:HlyC/CorC family transporter [Agaribacterium haliotis]|uniref:HlyC/CorC family transporter n=1 Tax=Agaribacterium haliotis TaxID=2013869 RepID=UPI000BB5584C|nr:HlyC/CorC family transporter [Agaribacterium haliotis]